MKIQTRDFGELEINPKEVVDFLSPIYGFENLRRFVLLYDDSLPGPFSWLQSIEDAKVCFILADPAAVTQGYFPQLPGETRKLLQVSKTEQVIWRLMMVIPKNFADATMNLKSPIIINPVLKCAAQVILDEDYPVRARLMGEETPC